MCSNEPRVVAAAATPLPGAAAVLPSRAVGSYGERETRARAELVGRCRVASRLGQLRQPEQGRRRRAPGERDEQALTRLVRPLRLGPVEDVAVELLGGIRVAGRCGAARELDAGQSGGPRRSRGLGRRERLSRQLLRPSQLTAGERERRLARKGERGVVVEPDASAKLSGGSVRLRRAPGILPSLREPSLQE